MKFLLVTSCKKNLVKVWVCQESSPAGSLLPPVDLASIASVIKHKGGEVRIIDLRLFRDPLKRYIEEVERFKPDAIVINLSTTSANYDYELISKTPGNVSTICFGNHAQSLREECFQKGVKYILLGDPEAALLNLIENEMDGVSSKGVLTIDAQDKVPCYWDNLDSMPFPSLELLDLHRYHAPYIKRGNLFTLLLGGRGCPHLCTYCLYPVLFGNRYRLRSINNIVDEIEENRSEFGIREFYFLDATFNAQHGRVEDFCEEILHRGLNVDWSCNMRVSPVSAEMLRLMKKAGCRWIFYGVEDQDYLGETKKAITRDLTVEAFRKTREAGILTMAFTMLFPRSEVDERSYAKNILSVIHSLKADAFQCNMVIPFPGTEMYDNFREKGTIRTDWSLYDPNGNALPYESERDLIKVKKHVHRAFVLFHPLLTLKIAIRMDFRAFTSTAVTFLRKNLLTSFFGRRSA